MTGLVNALVAALASSGLTAWANDGTIYPVANLVHLLGLVLLLGSIGLIDLRIMGVFPGLPLPALRRALTPLGVAGLMLMLASGTLMFAADARGLVGSETFQRKLIAIALALLNAALFHRVAGTGSRLGLAARVLAGLSLASWLTVATLGRLIAYR